jgi:hypothetical protein
MVDLKHVGRIKATGRKCLVAFRTLPGDAYHCLVVPTENLPDDYHDALIQLVESASGQSSNEFAEVLSRAKFSDGSTMLPALHTQGRLVRLPTDAIEMTPNFQAKIGLDELNAVIAQQRGVAIDDLAVKELNSNKVEVSEIATVKDISNNTSNDNVARTTSASVTQDEQPAVNALNENAPAEEKAKFYRGKADKLAKEAAQFRRMAEELVPTKKKSA